MRKAVLAAAVSAMVAGAGGASAQEWPTRPVTLVVPYAAGGPADVMARIITQRLSEILGAQVIGENVGGVFGDSGTFAANQTLYKKPLYNAATDFAPVGLVVAQSMVLLTRRDFPASNLQEFVA